MTIIDVIAITFSLGFAIAIYMEIYKRIKVKLDNIKEKINRW